MSDDLYCINLKLLKKHGFSPTCKLLWTLINKDWIAKYRGNWFAFREKPVYFKPYSKTDRQGYWYKEEKNYPYYMAHKLPFNIQYSGSDKKAIFRRPKDAL